MIWAFQLAFLLPKKIDTSCTVSDHGRPTLSRVHWGWVSGMLRFRAKPPPSSTCQNRLSEGEKKNNMECTDRRDLVAFWWVVVVLVPAFPDDDDDDDDDDDVIFPVPQFHKCCSNCLFIFISSQQNISLNTQSFNHAPCPNPESHHLLQPRQA